MQFEDLQAIWDTQHDRPVFSLDDSRLAVGLYQQRVQSRRRLFREQFAPIYIAALFVAAASALLFLAFYFKTVTRMRTTDAPMNIWDGAALILAAAAAVAVAAPMYSERKKHEHTQNTFAPSLCEELDRGISQLEFELTFYSAPRVLKMTAMVSIGAAVFLWESARLNGNPPPWLLLAMVLCIFPSSWYTSAAAKTRVEQITQRKRALEAIRAELSLSDDRSNH